MLLQISPCPSFSDPPDLCSSWVEMFLPKLRVQKTATRTSKPFMMAAVQQMVDSIQQIERFIRKSNLFHCPSSYFLRITSVTTLRWIKHNFFQISHGVTEHNINSCEKPINADKWVLNNRHSMFCVYLVINYAPILIIIHLTTHD